MRIITNHIDAVTQTQIEGETSSQELFTALGYLVTWNQTFPHVLIEASVRDGVELIATYRREKDGPIGYQIGAVWDDEGKRFSFHS